MSLSPTRVRFGVAIGDAAGGVAAAEVAVARVHRRARLREVRLELRGVRLERERSDGGLRRASSSLPAAVVDRSSLMPQGLAGETTATSAASSSPSGA